MRTGRADEPMNLLRHIRRCNEYRPERFLPLLYGSARIGWVRRDHAATLRRFTPVFAVGDDAVRLIAVGDFADLSAAVDRVVEQLVADGLVPKWRNEFFAVATRWGAPPLFKLDRGAVAFFGVRAYGVHLNGYVQDRGGPLQLWIGRRAADKKVAPNKLDNLVAGGIGYGHGLFETLAKEAREEADMPADFIARARPVGAVSYRMETREGARDDVLFVYDLEVPRDFVPRNTDGEIAEFQLMAADEVIERVRDTEDFKFNVNLVIIDFALRHGLVTPDERDYLDLVTGLRRPLD
jgi:8-oxo-dGTP pyrophosphatase MutT (NUDIX family)